MSKIGKRPIPLPDGVIVKVDAGTLTVSGKSATIALPVLPHTSVSVTVADRSVAVQAAGNHKQARANWGTMAALIRNAVHGVDAGFEKKLEIEGVGFKAQIEGSTLVLHVGFTHPVRFPVPPGIAIVVEKNIITVRGINKQLVGQTAAQIRKVKKPEPYKGKGIHYMGEVIRRKAGKKVAGTGTGTGAT